MLTNRLCHKFKCVNNLILRKIEANNAKDEPKYTFMQGGIIYLIKNSATPVYQRDIEKAFNIRRSTASGIIANMERDGLLTRITGCQDARLKQLVLTNEALLRSQRAEAAFESIEKQMISNISEEELISFNRVLDKMLDNLKNEV